MVVVPAVLVVVPDEQRLRPPGTRRHRIDHLGEERVAELDVLGVLLGGMPKSGSTNENEAVCRPRQSV